MMNAGIIPVYSTMDADILNYRKELKSFHENETYNMYADYFLDKQISRIKELFFFLIGILQYNVLHLQYNIIHIKMEAVIRKQTSFRLREDLLKVLQEEARKANRSLNNFVESTLMDAMYSEPNEETKAAIEEARTGKFAGTIDTSSMEAFIKSCE